MKHYTLSERLIDEISSAIRIRYSAKKIAKHKLNRIDSSFHRFFLSTYFLFEQKTESDNLISHILFMCSRI